MRAVLFVLALVAIPGVAQETPPPIIDMHLHALPADFNGPPPTAICAPGTEFPVWDGRRSYAETFTEWIKNPPCSDPIWGPETDEEVMRQTLEILERRNIYGVTSGPPPLLRRWKEAGGERIIPSLWFGKMLKSVPSPSEFRKKFEEGEYRVFAEVVIQYDGISPSDPMFEPYLAIAEELAIPVGIHLGPGPPGAPYLAESQSYRAALGSPLVLEEALVRHPRVRIYIMHAGWPMLADLLAVLWTHPQVYVDIAAIGFVLPRREFHRYLRRIVEAGFADRVLFGSDSMNWPGAIERAIESVESAPFLSPEQKRDILYNNAARFLRLSEAEIARHHEGR